MLLALVLLGAPARSQIRDVMQSSAIDRLAARGAPSTELLAKTNYAVELRNCAAAAAAPQKDAEADEFWFARQGSAALSLGGRKYEVHAGDVASVPRGTAYQVTPDGARFTYVAVRVFPAERRLRIGIGAAPEPHPMPPVARQAQIDQTLATAGANVTLHSAGAVLINHVIYKGAPGPHEVHLTCDDLYFVRMGTARAQLDGTLLEGREDPPGEIRGSGVRGAREFAVAPGDMVSIPRNTAHFMDPGSTRLGYLLVKVCD